MQNISSKINRNKIIILGDKNVGKTSIFSMIFTNIYPSETSYFESTKSISLSQIIFSGGELIEFEDCGFEENKNNENENEEYYIKTEIFENVSTMVFVINAEPFKKKNESFNSILNDNSSIDNDTLKSYILIKRKDFFETSLKLLNENSPDANIFIFIHKMDTILKDQRQNIFEEKKQEIIQQFNKYNSNIKIFATSIWDGSLYIPWRQIMSNMLVNRNIIEKGLNFLLEACDADEILLFEKSTLLCIISVDNGKSKNKEERIKKITVLIRKIKQCLCRNKEGFSCLKMRLNNIMVYIEEFSKYSYIMILSQKPKIDYEFLSLNIYILRESFEKAFNCKLLN